MGEIFKGDSCEVEVICDSTSYEDIRLTTVRLRYWRPIHSELMTHRVFSRNARSSRAVPVVTLLKEEPYIPKFQRNQPGMQAAEPLPIPEMNDAIQVWTWMMECCKDGVKQLHELGVHKQWANRPLEWFGWIDVLVSSTDWTNWFALRDHPAAMPEIAELAHLMYKALRESQSEQLGPGEWHLPYIIEEEKQDTLGGRAMRYSAPMSEWEKLKVLSAARCARISYKPFDGNADYEKEEARYNKLVGDSPVHASPTEHQATPDYRIEVDLGKGQRIVVWQNASKQGNFVGWCQHRKDIPNEAVMDDHYYS